MHTQPTSILRKGIRIFLPYSIDVSSSVLISEGTTQNVDVESMRGFPYQAESFLPNTRLRAFTPDESARLFPETPSPSLFQDYLSSSVGIIRVPKNVLTPMVDILDDLEIRSEPLLRCCEPEYPRILSHPGYHRANQLILDYIQVYALDRHDPKLIGLHIQPAGLSTITVSFDHSFSPQRRCRVGLHIDNWDRLPLLQKHQSRNRICINLGREDRVFLWINLPLPALVRSLELFGCNELIEQENWIALSKAFMRFYPNYPVVRLRIAPGEAYIESTDNLIHDASSLGKLFPDITWTALGHFGWTDDHPESESCVRSQSHACN